MSSVPSHRLGIDLGGTKILAVVIDRQGAVVGEEKIRTKADRGYEAVLGRVRDAASAALAAAGLDQDQAPARIGLGIPGVYDAQRGVVVTAPNLGWRERPLAADVARLWGRPVVLGNDVRCAALGELTYGAAAGCSQACVAFMGTGLGGAVVLDGTVLDGAHGFAGEIGHLPAPFDGARCGCGRTGCLETVASKQGIARLLAAEIAAGRPCALDPAKKLRSSQLRAAWDAGCPATRAALLRAAHGLAWGLVAMGTVVDPQCFVLGGGVIEAFADQLLPEIRQAMRDGSLFYRDVEPDLRLAGLGDRAAAIGAAVASAAPSRPAPARPDATLAAAGTSP